MNSAIDAESQKLIFEFSSALSTRDVKLACAIVRHDVSIVHKRLIAGDTMLTRILELGLHEILKAAIDAGLGIDDCHSLRINDHENIYDRHTMLEWAAAKGDAGLTRFLLDHGANPNVELAVYEKIGSHSDGYSNGSVFEQHLWKIVSRLNESAWGRSKDVELALDRDLEIVEAFLSRKDLIVDPVDCGSFRSYKTISAHASMAMPALFVMGQISTRAWGEVDTKYDKLLGRIMRTLIEKGSQARCKSLQATREFRYIGPNEAPVDMVPCALIMGLTKGHFRFCEILIESGMDTSSQAMQGHDVMELARFSMGHEDSPVARIAKALVSAAGNGLCQSEVAKPESEPLSKSIKATKATLL